MMAVCTTNHADMHRQRLAGMAERALLAVLPTGRAQAITARELGLLMSGRQGARGDERTVRRMVSDLRRKGVLIGSAISVPSGFYRPANLREAQECREQQARRLREVRRTVAAYDRAVRRMEWRETVAIHPLPGMDQGA